jgi:hypothetical protein
MHTMEDNCNDPVIKGKGKDRSKEYYDRLFEKMKVVCPWSHKDIIKDSNRVKNPTPKCS